LIPLILLEKHRQDHNKTEQQLSDKNVKIPILVQPSNTKQSQTFFKKGQYLDSRLMEEFGMVCNQTERCNISDKISRLTFKFKLGGSTSTTAPTFVNAKNKDGLRE